MSRKPPITCPRCGKVLLFEDFARDATKGSGYKSHCRECDNRRSRDYYRRNREAVIRRVRSAQVRKAREERERA